jgi:hypothetical protein
MMSIPVPTPFLLVEPTNPELINDPNFDLAVGWGLESETEALVYFKHPRREVREVGVFRSAEEAQKYYSEWGTLDLRRPERACAWPPDPGPRSQSVNDDADYDPWRCLTEPIWRAQQLPGK